MSRIDTLDEKKKWYEFVKSRIKILTDKETEKGELMLTEVREHVTLAVALLERIRAESSKLKDSSADVKEKTFKPWEKHIDEGANLKEEISRRETE